MAVEAVLFFIGIEAWKWAKRVFFRRRARNHSMPTSVEGVLYCNENSVNRDLGP
jgi:hypothetical protein